MGSSIVMSGLKYRIKIGIYLNQKLAGKTLSTSGSIWRRLGFTQQRQNTNTDKQNHDYQGLTRHYSERLFLGLRKFKNRKH